MLAAVLALLAAAVVEPCSVEGPLYCNATIQPLLRVAPPGGAGLPYVVDACDYAVAAGLLTGNSAFCLRGDGTQWSDGGTNLATVGSPLSVTQTACPSGPNCSTRTVQVLDGGGNYFKTGVNVGPSGDFTVCVLLTSTGVSGSGGMLLARDNGSERDFVLYERSTSDGYDFAIWQPDAGIDLANTLADTRTNDTKLVCAYYDFIADGTSKSNICKNSSCGTEKTTTKGPVRNAGTEEVAVGARDWVGNAAVTVGHVSGAFLTEQVLSAAQIAALDSAVRGKITGSRGETITTTRASTKFCANEDSSAGQTLAANTPCVRKGGLEVEPAGTNTVLRSEELNLWTAAQSGGPPAPVVTANTAVAPDGTLTAELVQWPNIDGGLSWVQSATAGCTSVGQVCQFSAWFKGVSDAGFTNVFIGNGGTGDIADAGTCAFTPSAWTRCTVAATTTQTGGHYAAVGNHFASRGAQPATSAYVWGAQLETGTYPSSYIRTEGTTATRAAETVTAPALSGLPSGASTAYCIGVTWTPPAGATAFSDVATTQWGLASIGTAVSANTSHFYIEGGSLVFDTYDDSVGQKYKYSAGGISFAEHRFVGCNNAGTFSFYVDGAAWALGVGGGAGTGLITTYPASNRVGTTGSLTGAAATGAIVKDFRIGLLGGCQ